MNLERDNLILNEKEATRFIIKLVHDTSIDEDFWEEKGQHIRDDVQYKLRKFGEVNLEEIARFHGSVVFKLYKKYFGDG